jgi:hypothetical protein
MSVKMKVLQGKPHGSFLDFPDGEFLIGRSPECHVRPNDEAISRKHCLLRVGRGYVFVRDLGSTNGTFVNGKRIADERLLNVGDTLQTGPLVLQVVEPPDLSGGPLGGIWGPGDFEADAVPFLPALGGLPGDPGIPVRQPGDQAADTPIPGSLRARHI